MQKDRDVGWTVKYTKAKPRDDPDVPSAADAYADTAHPSKHNEVCLKKQGFMSRIHVKKLKNRPMSEQTHLANARKSKVHSVVEHVFAHEKVLTGLIVCTLQ